MWGKKGHESSQSKSSRSKSSRSILGAPWETRGDFRGQGQDALDRNGHSCVTSSPSTVPRTAQQHSWMAEAAARSGGRRQASKGPCLKEQRANKASCAPHLLTTLLPLLSTSPRDLILEHTGLLCRVSGLAKMSGTCVVVVFAGIKTCFAHRGWSGDSARAREQTHGHKCQELRRNQQRPSPQGQISSNLGDEGHFL